MCDRLSIVVTTFLSSTIFTHRRIPASPEQWQHGDLAISRKTHNFFGLSLILLQLVKTQAQILWLVSCPVRANRQRGRGASSPSGGHSARVIFVFPCSFASSTARARSFCTHQRPRITESTVLKHIHRKGRRQLQLSRRRWLHDCTASYVKDRSRHIFRRGHSLRGAQGCALVQDTTARSLFGLYVPTCTDGACQVRVACAKPQTVQRSGPGPGRWSHESVEHHDPVSCSCVVYGTPIHKTTFHNFSF